MKIEVDENTSSSVLFIAAATVLIVLITQVGSCGRHTQSQIVKATTCEQVAALSGEGVSASDILLCQNKEPGK